MDEHWSDIIFYPVWNHITAHMWLYVGIFLGLCLIVNITGELQQDEKYKQNKTIQKIHNIALCLFGIPIGLFILLFALLHFGGVLFEYLRVLWKVPGTIGLFIGMWIMLMVMICKKSK